MPYRIALTERNAGVNGITGLFTAGSKIRIYGTTTQPATPETAVPGGSVLLAEVPFNATTAFQTATTGTGVATGLPVQATILASGTAAWFRFVNGAGTPAALGDGTITTVAVGTGDMLFDNTTFVQGGIVSITDLSISIPM